MSMYIVNTELLVPTKPYYLRETTNAMDEISRITENFKYIPTDIELHYQPNMIYGQFDAPSRISVITSVNGVNGFFLKKTIRETGIAFIWFDVIIGHYLFWGNDKKSVINAMNKIRNRIIKYTVYVKPIANVETDKMRSPSPEPEQIRPVSRKNIRAIQTPEQDNDKDNDNVNDGEDIFTTPPPPLLERTFTIGTYNMPGENDWEDEDEDYGEYTEYDDEDGSKFYKDYNKDPDYV